MSPCRVQCLDGLCALQKRESIEGQSGAVDALELPGEATGHRHRSGRMSNHRLSELASPRHAPISPGIDPIMRRLTTYPSVLFSWTTSYHAAQQKRRESTPSFSCPV
jgi:hypothetical protein